jgi:hypothetical protein
MDMSTTNVLDNGKNHTGTVPDEDEGGAAGAFVWRHITLCKPMELYKSSLLPYIFSIPILTSHQSWQKNCQSYVA